MADGDPTDGFTPEWHTRWTAAHRRIDQAGYGDSVGTAYRQHGPKLGRLLGPSIAVRLAPAISHLAIRCGRRAAALLPESALTAAGLLGDESSTLAWLEAVEGVAKLAPESVPALLENTSRIIGVLGLAGFVAFVRVGASLSLGDAARRLAFFSLQSAEARRFLETDAGAGGLSELREGLRLYLKAIWGINPQLAEAPLDGPEQMRRRPGFGGGGIRLPASFAGYNRDETKLLYQAALAHIGAHHRFTRMRFPVGTLKPLQIAIISIVEDARAERLAVHDMPGLQRLWSRFHVARAEGTPLAITLMARLSRALIDPDYQDSHGWVEKGKALFEEAAANDLADQDLSRRIGGLLGNDIGQTRLQFDAKSYIIQPAYRDDNLGIWDFGADEPPAMELEATVESGRVECKESDDGRQEESPDPSVAAGRAVGSQQEDAVVVLQYPEYDYVAAKERPQWCTVREVAAPAGSTAPLQRQVEQNREIVNRLSALIRSSKVSRQQRVRRLMEGEFLDIDASIEAAISRRARETPEDRVYGRYQRRSRDLSVLVLLDISKSTDDPIPGAGGSVLDAQRLSTALLAHAMAELGDPFAIAAFCSNGRDDVRYLRIKEFDRPYDRGAIMRLAGLTSGLSTRLGPIIRHAGEDLRRRRAYRRLLLIITDGEPSDIDVDDRRYLVEDARMAVHDLWRHGIDPFCVGLDSDAESYASRIFGHSNAIQIDSVERLPEKLPKLYLRLTR